MDGWRVRPASFELNTPVIHGHPVAAGVGDAGVNQQHQVGRRGLSKDHFQVDRSLPNEAERQVSLWVKAAERLI